MFNGMPNQQFQQPQQQQQQQQQQGGNNGFLFGGPDLNTIARAKQQAFSSSGNSQLMSMFNGCNSGGNEPQTPCNMSPCGMMGPNTTMFNLMPLTTPQKQGHANNQQQQQQGNYNGMSFNSNLNSIPVPDHPSSAFPSFDCIMNQTQNSQTNNTFGGPAAFGGMPNLMNLNNQPGNQMNQGSNWNQMPCNNGFFPGPCGSNNGQMQNQQHGHQNGENGMIQMRTLF